MTKKITLLFIPALFFLLITGCKDASEGSENKMRSWYQRGTELAYPPDARYLAGKNTSAWLSDVYLKLQVSPEYKQTLDENLSLMKNPPSLDLPEDMKPWVPWDLEGKKLTFYEHRTGNIDEGGFHSQLAFEAETGLLYVHIVEFAP